jgi:phospholipid transport system substrate-binding protein
MLASTFIVLLTTEALASAGELPAAEGSIRHVASARVANPRTTLPSPTLELRKSTEALRKSLARRHPGWSPEAEAQASSVQAVIDDLLDFDEIARRTLGNQWGVLGAEQRHEFVDTLQKLIERRPLERGLSIDLESAVTYKDESIVRDQATVATTVTSYTSGRPNRRSVDYRLFFRSGRWRVYDIIIEGVSMVDDYRAQFARIISEDSFDGLLRRMHRKVGDPPAIERAQN